MQKSFERLFVFDVESIGLHGEGYAAAYVVIDKRGDEFESGLFASNPNDARGDEIDRQWVEANVPKLLVNCASASIVRAKLFQAWLSWKPKHAAMFADCMWPVETNFLSLATSELIQTMGEAAKWLGPYPLLDIATLEVLLPSRAPYVTQRDVNIYPLHNPLADARYSAKKLLELLS